MSTIDTAQQDVYEAWKDVFNDPEEATEELFEQAYIGQFFDTEELAKYLIDEAGMADVDSILNKIDDALMPYFRFDYAMYGRDLELGGDVYTVDTFKPLNNTGYKIRGTHYFWTNV